MTYQRPQRTFTVLGRSLLFAVYGVPLLVLLAISVKSEKDITKDPAGLLFAPTGEQYVKVGADAGPALANSAQIALGTMLLTVCLAVPGAYGLSRKRTRAWTATTTVLLAAIIVLQMVPQPMSVIPLYNVLARLGVINTIVGVVLANSALLLPFALLLLRPFFVSIPRELEEAAICDGASLPRMFFRVVVPLARNGIVTVSVMVFMLSWGEFIYGATFLTAPDAYPVSALLAQQVSLYGTDWGRLMALAVVTTVPILLVFLFSQRRLAEGMLTGAVK
ncbi:carbohydrate ABC transporter permease [Sciscionella marina]|uniref:carbohydrate ABC transporter permease n=1 Tax=Sciscionella marina TaxID=508770 RepID=UPI0003AAB07B|nr:carbohydrate ABC transporter permease [Sciscionella marina]